MPKKDKHLKLSQETHAELMKLTAELTAKNGKRRTFDDIILMLIEAWRKKKVSES